MTVFSQEYSRALLHHQSHYSYSDYQHAAESEQHQHHHRHRHQQLNGQQHPQQQQHHPQHQHISHHQQLQLESLHHHPYHFDSLYHHQQQQHHLHHPQHHHHHHAEGNRNSSPVESGDIRGLRSGLLIESTLLPDVTRFSRVETGTAAYGRSHTAESQHTYQQQVRQDGVLVVSGLYTMRGKSQ